MAQELLDSDSVGPRTEVISPAIDLDSLAVPFERLCETTVLNDMVVLLAEIEVSEAMVASVF